MKRKRGVSLIETMMAIALLAIIVVSILSAFSAITIAAARHKQQTTLDLLVRSDAEYIGLVHMLSKRLGAGIF